ncbi:tRNA lysidine(34) synthetase TilS [Arenibaculum pallidiluteum]|uniref:tRNA lysidine(34) synthetase TilS n=1 Tax=Arenibaculum pallidiluteum TaxID=2812559 RepID=UPI001A969220|nr:tRNA lysidine(34) synthetase TilS [Arenibaculum pallidiluteum]
MTDDDSPLSQAAFADLLDRLGPFEPRPRLAVGVSGGPDSLALCLLAHGWAVARGGHVLALTVDHGLRPGSAAEAAQVGTWLGARGIAHAVLSWTGPKPGTGIQEAARAARLALLEARCHAEGILHLLLAHQREDQAETVLMRLARGSGPDGLAGMPAVRESQLVRILRPLLTVSRTRLASMLAQDGQPWVEDPANRSQTFARARLRRSAAVLAEEGLTAGGLGETARRCAGARAALDRAVTALLARSAEIRPEGWILLDAAVLEAAEPELRLRALLRCLETVGQAPVRRAAAEALAAELPGCHGRTLGGCLVRRWRGRILVAREPSAVQRRIPLVSGEPQRWDGRFLVDMQGTGGLAVGALGEAGRQAVQRAMGAATAGLPAPVLETLPAFWSGERLIAVPSVGFRDMDGDKDGTDPGMRATALAARAVFAPERPLGSAPFAVV